MFEAHTLFVTKFVDYHTYFTLIVIALAILSYVFEKISLELTSLFVISTFMIFFHFFPLNDAGGNNALSTNSFLLGFADPSLITIVSMLIIGQAIIQSNALNIVPKLILNISQSNGFIAIFISLFAIILISAFMNNTPVVVIFIPILSEVARKLNISASKVMIPLSYASILGGMTTLIGSSTNLLISGSVQNLGLPALDFFEFIIPGSIMAFTGLMYIMFYLPKTLPDNAKDHDSYIDDRPFISQINICIDSKLIDSTLIQGHLPGFPNLTIRAIERDEQIFLPPFQDDMILRESDIVTISGTRNDLATLVHKKPNVFLKNLHFLDEDENNNSDSEITEDQNNNINVEEANLAELVVAPASRLIGNTIKNAEFYTNYNCPVIGIQRKGNLIKSKMTNLHLIAGDVLLILGDINKILALRNNKDLILTKWSTQQISSITRIIKTLVIFFSVITLSALNIIPLSISAFTAAGLLILLNCINIRQAARSIDRTVVLLIVASIAMGTALQATGAASLIASSVVGLLEGLSTSMIIACFFIFITVMTNLLSNAATAVIFTPVAINLALKLMIDPKIFIFAMIFACNSSFITPIGYQTNLLVMSPGKYKFYDFVKSGIPLALLLCYVYILLLKYYFNIT